MTPRDPESFEAEVEIRNRLGLHARAATSFVKTATAFDCDVQVGKDGRWVDGKGILGLMTLEAGPGTRVGLRVRGAQADAALLALVELIERGFDEDVG